MANLTATNWTITQQKKIIAGPSKVIVVKAVLDSGNIPASGVPGPTRAALGFTKYLTNITIVDEDDSKSYHWKYDQANNKFRVQGLIQMSSGIAWASDGSGLDVALATGRDAIGTSGALALLSGNLAEMTSGITLAENTMYLEARGW